MPVLRLQLLQNLGSKTLLVTMSLRILPDVMQQPMGGIAKDKCA
jgi:hypothetical protein